MWRNLVNVADVMRCWSFLSLALNNLILVGVQIDDMDEAHLN